ncbi:MAG: peptidylprolyl isomerase [Prosthecobacter sp.]
MKTRLFLFLVTLAVARAGEEGAVVGSMGGVELREREVVESLVNLGVVDREALARDPASVNRLVKTMLVQRLVFAEALDKGWDRDPSIQALLKSTREAAISDSYLKSLSQPPDGYPSEVELKAAYEDSRASLTVPRSYRLAQIYIAAPVGLDEKAAVESRLQAALDRLRAPGTDFGVVAIEFSEEKESASRSGEIGWLREDQIQPEILAQVARLKLNVVSEPVRLADGWHILKVLDAREPFTPIFDQVRAQLAQKLRAEKVRAGMQAYMAELLQKHPVEIDTPALSKLFRSEPLANAGKQP